MDANAMNRSQQLSHIDQDSEVVRQTPVDESPLLTSNNIQDRPINIKDGLTLFGDNFGTINIPPIDPQQDVKAFLTSIYHPDISARYERIASAQHKTFEWIFEDSDKAANVGFVEWLRDPTKRLFLVEGKAGSGKSTLMKFLSLHGRTPQLFKAAQVTLENPDCIVLFHSFWLVGTKLQHNLKGLLASLLFQLVSACPDLAAPFDFANQFTTHIDAWTSGRLHDLLKKMWPNCGSNILLFVDGLDEFDPDDDLDNLDKFLKFVALTGTKLCLSTRPIKAILDRFSGAQQIRLQELTAGDISRHVRKTLAEKTADLPSTLEKENLTERLANEMCSKADGVFLWVYYVLKNVCLGLSNEDELELLMRRIHKLPSGMIDLYRHMWLIMNKDHSVYQDEARKLFELGPFLPCSLLEVTIILSDSAQEHFRTNGCPMEEQEMASLCKRQHVKISARSAGLLESFIHSDWDDVEEDELSQWFRINQQVQYFHRTVQDFLHEGSGHQLIGSGGKREAPSSEVLERYVVARIGSCIQRAEPLDFDCVDDVLWILSIFDHDFHSFPTVDEVFQCHMGDSDNYLDWVHQLNQEAWQDEYAERFEPLQFCYDPTSLRFCGIVRSLLVSGPLQFDPDACIQKQVAHLRGAAQSKYYVDDLITICILNAIDTVEQVSGRFTDLYLLKAISWYCSRHTFPAGPNHVALSFVAHSPALSWLSSWITEFFTHGRHNVIPFNEQLDRFRKLTNAPTRLVGQAITFCLGLPPMEHRPGDELVTAIYATMPASLVVEQMVSMPSAQPLEAVKRVATNFMFVRNVGDRTRLIFAHATVEQHKELATCFPVWLRERICLSSLAEAHKFLEDVEALVNSEELIWSDHVPESFYGDLEPDMYFAQPGYPMFSMPVDPNVDVDPKDWKKACTMRLYFEHMDKVAAEKAAQEAEGATKIPEPTNEPQRLVTGSATSSSELVQRDEGEAKQADQSKTPDIALMQDGQAGAAPEPAIRSARPQRRRELSAIFKGFQK